MKSPFDDRKPAIEANHDPSIRPFNIEWPNAFGLFAAFSSMCGRPTWFFRAEMLIYTGTEF
jgi:hypothetical protein